jgi:hypothetical protein
MKLPFMRQREEKADMGVLLSILQQANLSKDEFIELLK